MWHGQCFAKTSSQRTHETLECQEYPRPPEAKRPWTIPQAQLQVADCNASRYVAIRTPHQAANFQREIVGQHVLAACSGAGPAQHIGKDWGNLVSGMVVAP